MDNTSRKRVAKLRITLNKRNVEDFKPAQKPWIAWGDRLTVFGVRVHPLGTKAFIVNYRAGEGGGKASSKQVVIGHYGRITADQVRRLAQEFLGWVADERVEALYLLRWNAQTRRVVARGRRARSGSAAWVRGLTGILFDIIQCCVERRFFLGGVGNFGV